MNNIYSTVFLPTLSVKGDKDSNSYIIGNIPYPSQRV